MKMNLTEATLLALQGKLEESLDISIQEDGSKMIDTDNETVVIQDKYITAQPEVVDDIEEPECSENCDEEEIPETVEVPTEGADTIIPEEEIPEEQVEEITSKEEPTVDEIADGDTDLDESKQLDEKRLNNNTFTDEDEAEYYRNKELYANSGLARHKEAMEKAKEACDKKGIEVDETQGVYESKKTKTEDLDDVEQDTQEQKLTSDMTDEEIVDYIVNNYKDITGEEVDSVFANGTNATEDSPIFNQEAIDKVSDKIINVLDEADITGKRLEDILYALDDKLAMMKTGEVETEKEPEISDPEPELDESKKVTEKKDTPELVQKAKDWKKRVTASKSEDELEEIVEEIMDAVKDLSETNWAAEDLYNEAEGVMDDQDAADRGPATYIRSVKTNFKNILTDFINNYADACADAELDEGKKVQESKKLQERDTSKEAILDSVNNKIVPELEWVAEFGKDAGLYSLAELCEEYANTLRNTKIEESKKVEDKEEVKEQCDCGYSKKTFDEVLTKYFKSEKSKTESFSTDKVLINDKSMKVEGKILMVNGNTKDVTLTFNKIQEGTSFVKYEMTTTGLLKESKAVTPKLMTRTNKNVMKCCYITK